eukprot:Skav225680  [mRNA]  locus=scaffold1126:63834:65471:+ [translate_table: standard]
MPCLSITWPNPDEQRKEEKLQALQDLGHEPISEVDSEIVLAFELKDGTDFDALVDVMQVLVLTDLELCYWPPSVFSSTEANCALRQLAPCARRRGILAAQRLLRTPELVTQCPLICQPELVSCRVDMSHLLGSAVAKHPALRASEVSEGRGLGLTLAEEVDAGEELLMVPEDLLLNVYTALKSKRFGHIARQLLLNGLHVETVTMLFAILEHRSKDPDPRWKALLERAPRLTEDLLPLSWPIEALEELGPQVAQLVQETLKSLWQLSQEIFESLSRLPEVDQHVVGVVNFDELLWARCLFDSRAVSVEIAVDMEMPEVSFPSRVVCLAPEVDLLNHSHVGTCAPPSFDSERRMLIVKLAAKAAAGSEVCLSYGPLQNWELLFYYGFCPAVNPHDRFVINVDLPEDESTAQKEVVLQLHGIPTEVALRPPPVEVGEGWCALGLLPPQLLRCFRVLLGEIGSDLDAAPGEEDVLELDLRCFAAMEELILGLLEPLQGPAEAPSWWPIYGPRIEAFRASQRHLLQGNLQQLRELSKRFQQPNKKPRRE